MKKITIFVCLFFLVYMVALAQTDQKLKISTERMGEGLYDFYAENPNFYSMQLELKFTEFSNMEANCELPFVSTINPGKHLIFKIKRTLIDLPGGFKYTYTTRVGAFPVQANFEANYYLPFKAGFSSKLIAYDYSGSRTPEKIVWGFGMNYGDTVFACRDGVVCQLAKVQMRDSLKVGDNTLTILHGDQTFGKYELLADNSFLVNLSDTIQAGTALARVGINQFTKVPHVRFSVYYVNARIDSINQNRLWEIHSYINPVFIDSKGQMIQLVNDLEIVN